MWCGWAQSGIVGEKNGSVWLRGTLAPRFGLRNILLYFLRVYAIWVHSEVAIGSPGKTGTS